MTKILGLDLGITSIGWALVSENNEKKEIIGMGSRIIPLNVDDKDEFSSGNKISKNQKRTIKRTQRKGYDRYQLRRKLLTDVLIKTQMFDEKLFKLTPLELWGLRAKAISEKISLNELGRLLYHLNQKRGYKSSRSDANLDKKDTEYIIEVKSRHQTIKEKGITIGQFFFAELQKSQHYKIKQQVFPREAYVEEFEAICKCQQEYYPQVLSNEFIKKLRDEIIYYQRKLKSQKGLVSVCEFEGSWVKTKEDKDIFVGPKVTPKSSPLFQVCKIWETINNINLKNKKGESFTISNEKKKEIFEYLDVNEKLTQTDIFNILKLKKDDGWYGNKQILKGLQGNLTKHQLLKYLDKDSPLLTFNIHIEEKQEESYLIDRKTGEILNINTKKNISTDFTKQPLNQLWHIIYSIDDLEECTNTLTKKFNIEMNVAKKLAAIDYRKYAFGNKSSKSIRKILPYLIEGFTYSDASSFAGYNHSGSLTKDENLKRKLLDIIPNLSKNSLRQPIVEKILNQLINVVNSIIQQYGKPDEIRIELARELKQSREERNDSTRAMEANSKINEEFAKRLNELNVRATKKNINKYKFIFPIRTVLKKDGKFDKKSFENAQVFNQCIYCGESFSLTEALNGDNFDVDHIIPKSLLFDDSQTNKVLVHRKCNADDKKNKTAYDYIRAKGETELYNYLERIDNWYKQGVLSYSKLERLKISHEDYIERKRARKTTTADKKIWENFIERQLRESQYISKKAKEILEGVCHKVWSTSGEVTSYLRNVWGWNDVLMNLQLPRYRKLGLTIWEEWESNNGQNHKKEIIKGWTKRDDHRHHAIDALVIACTKQGFVQRINTLNSLETKDSMKREIEESKKEYNKKKNLLDNYFESVRPFNTKTVENKVSEILISFKPGKKVATIGKRKVKKDGKKLVIQENIIIPRGSLSEESVYGKIKTIEKKKSVKYLFENPSMIFKPYIKSLVEERLLKYNNDPKKSLSSLKKEPIYLNKEKTKLLEYGTCFKEVVVIKYPLESIKAKDVDFIIDGRIKELVKVRLEQYNNKDKEAFKDPLYFNHEKNIPIKTVRMLTGLSAVEPVKKDLNGKEIGFVKPGNNHHIVFYIDENGEKREHICSFWHAVERKKYNIPVIVKNPTEVWNTILMNNKDYPQSFIEKLPNDKWKFDISLQQNEMLILGMQKDEFEIAVNENNKALLSKYLYTTWSISENDYWFRHHIETKNSELKSIPGAKESNRFYRCKSIGAFTKLNPQKVRINNIGEIIF